MFKNERPKDGFTLPEKLYNLKNYCIKMFDALEKEQNDTKQNYIPVGTAVLRPVSEDNAGFNYGKWDLKSGMVTIGTSQYYIYVRTE